MPKVNAIRPGAHEGNGKLSDDSPVPPEQLRRYILFGKLGKLSRTPNGWQARCPAHDDENPSLSVALGERGRILLHCHAGCSFREIVSALGMRAADFAPDPAPGSTARPTASALGEKASKTGFAKSLKRLSALDGAKADG